MGTSTQGWLDQDDRQESLLSSRWEILREDIPWQQENVEESRRQAQIGGRKEARKACGRRPKPYHR